MASSHSARQVMERIDALGGISEEPDRLTRRFATYPLVLAADTVGKWMRGAGMTVRNDNIGNIIGRYGAADDGDRTRTLVVGSHLDSVRDAGRFDGSLGVLVGIGALERLHARNQRLPFAVEVIGFADKEGARFGEPYLGSKAVCGRFDRAYLDLIDEDGVRMADAIRTAGGTPEAIGADVRDGAELLGYCEVHIEQGPVLETKGLPVGVVSAFVGKSSIRSTFSSEDRRTDGVPMEPRQDALLAAAEFVLGVNATARSKPELVATVGQIKVAAGHPATIPSRVTLNLDVRHRTDAVRKDACRLLERRAREIASHRGTQLEWEIVYERPAVSCSPELSSLLACAVEEVRTPVWTMASGAGHDAAVMAAMTPTLMLFVRCAAGVTHSPAESVAEGDVAVAINVLSRFFELLARTLDSGRS